MLKKIIRALRPNPLHVLLNRAKKRKETRFLIVWNRGLGDIPLGLYALNQRIHDFIPNVQITYLTRHDLAMGFAMLEGSNYIIDPIMKRGKEVDIEEALSRAKRSIKDFDVIIPKADPTYWVKGQIGHVVPKLNWDAKWDALADKYGLSGDEYIGAHVDTETGQYYRYEKNWPKKYWIELFKKTDKKVVLFGMKKDSSFQFPNVIDLRGDTTLQEMFSIIKNHCSYLIAPDSGVLSTIYYVNMQSPLHIYSIWSDPRQGVLKQNVASPNALLHHHPFISEKDISQILPKQLLKAIQNNSVSFENIT